MELDEQEAAFVKAFIVQDKQERYLRLLASPKRRRDILDRFNHNLDFKPEYAELIPQELRTADKVAGLLRARGAGKTCHVIADSLDADGQDMSQTEAVDKVIAHDFGSVLCCLPRRLAFYKAETVEQAWYIFERRSNGQS